MPTTTPARTKRQPRDKKDFADLHIRSEDDETFTATIFDDDQPFVFSRDVNAFLQLQAFSGEPGAISKFMLSLVEVEVPDDASDLMITQARFETRRRFEDILSTQKGLSLQRLIQFTVDLTDAAGNGNLA